MGCCASSLGPRSSTGGQAQGPSARSVKPPNSGFRSLSTPTCVLPQQWGWGGEPKSPRKGCGPARVLQSAVSGGNTPESVFSRSCRTPPAPRSTHPLRHGTVPPRVTVRSLRGERAGCCLLSGAGGSSRHSPALAGKSQPGAAEARCSQWGLRRWAGWRLSPSQGPELRRSGARRPTPRPGTEGEEPKEEEESQIRHRRTTAHQGYRGATGPTPASPHPRPPA